VTPEGAFESQVNLTTTVYPSIGLSVSLMPEDLVLGSGPSKATFSSSTPGDYTITITGRSGSLSHPAMVAVAVTPIVFPDFEISVSSDSISIASSNSGITRVTVTPNNGFMESVTIVASAPTGVSCNLSPAIIQPSGTSTLKCESGTAGDYLVTIKATGGSIQHTMKVNVHVAVSPVAPAPSTILGLAPAIIYGIVAVIILIVVAGTVLVRRTRRSSAFPP